MPTHALCIHCICYVIAIQTDANVLYNIRSLIPQLKQTRPLSGSPNSPLPASSHTTTVAITSPGPQPTFQSHSPRPAHIECHTNKLPVHTPSYPQLTYSVYKSVYKFPCLPQYIVQFKAVYICLLYARVSRSSVRHVSDLCLFLFHVWWS